MDILKRTRVLCGAALLLLLTVALFAPGTSAGSGDVTKEQVEAAFLYHFCQFVEWPATAFTDASSPIVIGVLGRDPFGSVLDNTLKGKMSGGRSIQIRRASDPAALTACHIVFISTSEQARTSEVLGAFGTKPILTVGGMHHFAHTGGAINFFLVDKKVKFEVNPKAGEKAGLKFSSKLLSVGQVVS